MTLIAEDLLLLLLDDESGALNGTSYPQTVLGGALLIELAATGAAEVEEKQGRWRSAKVRATDAPPEDPVLRAAYDVVAEKPRSAQDLVDRLGKGARDTLAERLVERGLLERRESKMLGLFPRTRWPASDTRHEEEVRRRLTATLVQGVEPDQRTGALVALLSAIDKAHKVVDHRGLPAKEVRKRAKAVAEGAWAAKAVRDAISASTAAIAVATTAATSAAFIS
ncbi:GPP34 family phosphoprotein [Nocardioides sp. W7]|uniref:GOLPH3/VPS74 family protein n=1 Tax=Nocardioides sp. W7 TaxID=2931390 RepID=UPI001FD204DB|nr:GPP34 family phosphoprotein [Nocardioides sp. W7]